MHTRPIQYFPQKMMNTGIILCAVLILCCLYSCNDPYVELIEPPKPSPLVDALPESISVHNIQYWDTLNGWLCASILGHGNKYKGGIYKTNDGGKTWLASHLSEKSSIGIITFINHQYGWATGDKGLILSTVNGGQSWNVYDSKILFGDQDTLQRFGRVHFINNAEGWIIGSKNSGPIDCGGYGYILHTLDGGTTWTMSYETTEGVLQDIMMLNNGNGWIVGGGHFLDCPVYIMHTVDNGFTWTRQVVDQNITGVVYEVKFYDEHIGLAIGTMGILRTTDGGSSWGITGVNTGRAYALSVINDSIVYSLAGDFHSNVLSIYKSTNQGKEWYKRDEVDSDLYNLYFLNDSTGWIAGDLNYPTGFTIYSYIKGMWSKVR